MEHQLDYGRAVFDEVFFELVDLLVSCFHGFRRNELFHFHDKNVLVMRSVEDADHAFWRHRFVHPPKVIAAEFIGVRSLERGDLHAHRSGVIEHRADGSVLPARVGALQYYQKRAGAFRIEPVLQLVDGLRVPFRAQFCLAFVQFGFCSGVDCLELNFLAGLHGNRCANLGFVLFHSSPFLRARFCILAQRR